VAGVHWSENSFGEVFVSCLPERILLVADHDGELMGFLIARFSTDESDLENIVVASRHCRKGIATQLMRKFISIAQERGVKWIHLEVRASNAAAQALYRRFGFLQNGVRMSYYSGPQEDAIVYRLVL
jgi:ribosomal-protein-alanine N-acetyltransferase